MIIALFTMVASSVTTLVGFGVGTIMTPILALFLPYQQALIVVGWIHMTASLMKTIVFRKYIDWSIFFKCGISGIAASALGASLVTALDKNILVRFLGAAVLAYVILEIVNPSFKIRQSNLTLVVGGAVTGFSAGFFGLRGILVAMMLSSFGLTKEAFIGVTGAFSVLVDAVRLGIYHHTVTLPAELSYGLLFYVPLSLLSVHGAAHFVSYISVKLFKQIVAGALFLIGLKLLIFGA